MLLCRSSRDSREDRELYQAKTVKTHSNNLVVLAHVQLTAFLPPFYRLSTRDVTHVRKMYQALSRFSVLQATGSWAGAWERGYVDPSSVHLLISPSVYISTDLTVQLPNPLFPKELNVPGRQHCVLGSEAMDTAILHAEGCHSPTFPVNHDQIQSKELDKIVAVVAKGLKRWRQGKRGNRR